MSFQSGGFYIAVGRPVNLIDSNQSKAESLSFLPGFGNYLTHIKFQSVWVFGNLFGLYGHTECGICYKREACILENSTA